MLTFHIENLYTRIEGADEHEIAVVRDILSCYVPGYRFTKAYKQHRWNGKKYFLTKKGFFPTGLLNYLLKKLPLWIYTETIDNRNPPRLYYSEPRLNNIVLRPYQRRVISIACSKKRGVIQAPPGSGKTEIALGIISALSYPKTLYLVHQKDLLHQTAARIADRLSYEPGIIGDKFYQERLITVATVQTLHKRIADPRTVSLLKNTQLLIIDECHHASADTWYKIAMKTPQAFYRFGLSATPMVASSLRNMKLAAATGSVIAKIREEKLIEHGYLCPPEILILNVNSARLPSSMTYSHAYRYGIIENSIRNNIISARAKQLAAEGKTVLVLVERIEHGRILEELLNFPFITGEENKKTRKEAIEKLSKREIPALIATTIFDEGIDVPAIDAVIMAAGGKSYTRCIQRIGRSMRPDTQKTGSVIIDFMDNCHPYLKKHSLKRIEFYKKKNYKVTMPA